MKTSKVAKRYALSLYLSAKEINALDTILADTKTIHEYLTQATDLRAVFRSPVIQGWRKKGILAEVFGSSISPLMKEFLSLLCEKGRENIIEFIFKDFETLYNSHFGLLPVIITSVVDLGEQEKNSILATLSTRYNAKPLPTYIIDKRIQGGLLVSVGNTLYDMSLRTQLGKLRYSLIHG